MTQTQTITVTLRLFALYRERLGRDRMEMALPVGATVAAALAELARLHPQVLPLVEPTRVAVNQEYALPDQPLRHGDELVLIPPVSGGQAGQCPASSAQASGQLSTLSLDGRGLGRG